MSACSTWWCAMGVPASGRRLGARAARRDRGCARAAVGLQPPRRIEPPAQTPSLALRRRDDRGGRRGVRLQPRLLGQLPGRGRGRPVRHDPGPPRHRAPRPSPGRSSRARVPGPGGRHGLAGRGSAASTRSTILFANGSRAAVARSAPAGPDQQLGGDLFRFRRRPARRDRHHGRSGHRAVRPRRRLVRPARRRHDLARRLVRGHAQAAERRRRARRRVTALGLRFGPGSSRRWSAHGAGCSRCIPIGPSACLVARGARAASSWSWTWPARRSSTTSSTSISGSWPARRSRTSSGT